MCYWGIWKNSSLFKVCHGYAKGAPYVHQWPCQGYAMDMPKVCYRYAMDTPKVYNRYANGHTMVTPWLHHWHMPEIPQSPWISFSAFQFLSFSASRLSVSMFSSSTFSGTVNDGHITILFYYLYSYIFFYF